MTDAVDAFLSFMSSIQPSRQIVQRGTYAIFLRGPVVSLTDADSEALLADGLVQAGLDWLASLIRHMSGHLWRHWQLLKL